MTSVQERLQINRMPLDKWSIREQLCLASSVACSGDQNWMSVSRSLKIVCVGNTKDTLQSRPVDWFSQKNCAVQYGHLLEEVKTPKLKKRSSESSVSPSPNTTESPTEAIVKRLTEERMQEIKLELKREQEMYAKLYAEIKSIQSGRISDDQLLQMWKELEKEQEMQRIEEMKLENQLRERELKKQELNRSWRTCANTHSSSSSINSLKSSTDTTAVDMDVEEIIGSCKTVQTGNNTTAPLQTATSPLLSSLLKTVTTASPAAGIVGTSSVRSTAPTITTLLTGGSIPNQNQPAIIPSHDDAIQLLTRPISGPPLDTIATSVSITQNSLSPSQSAPTLSMLLEKNKTGVQNSAEPKSVEFNSSQNVEAIAQTNDSNNESVPMDIEEDLTATKVEVNSDMPSNDIDDTDPIEEQQLLEVFKNIGNIEELGIDVSDVIDEEVDFLKGVDEEAPLDDNLEIEQKLEENDNPLSVDIKLLSDENTAASMDNANTSSPLSRHKTLEEKIDTSNKVEIISSDDSNDNIPLAAVASLESSKDRLNMNESSNEEHFLKDQVESAILKNEVNQVDIASEVSPTNTVAIKQEILEENEKIQAELDVKKEKEELERKDQKDDVFIAPTAEDLKQLNIKSETEEIPEEKRLEQKNIKLEAKDENELNDTANFNEIEKSEQSSNTVPSDMQNESADNITASKLQPPASISIADTDENSSSTDISVQTRKDEKLSRGHRKSPHEANKTDDEILNQTTTIATPNPTSTSGTLTPRPTALRKLRDRDRSESPMIDDDATTHSDHSTTNQRSRRRYSSTPVIDSIPNSPASSDRDERDLRTSKKSLLSIYNVLYSSKYSNTLQRVLSDESSRHRLDEICLRSIDFVTIKKNIESGLTRSVYELQRDVLWMCQNALMVTKSSSATFKSILQFQQEFQNIREFMPNGCEPCHKLERDTKSNSSTVSSTGGGTSKGRSGSRKSLRLS